MMSLLTEPLPLASALAGWALALPFVWAAAHRLREGFLADAVVQHAWLAGMAGVALLWSAPIESPLGFDLALLGSALYAVIFGYTRAVVGLTGALVLHTVLAGGAWSNLGINAVLLAIFPAVLAHLLQRAIEHRLPHNVFVFIFGNGLAVTLVVTALTAMLLLGVTALATGASLTDAADHFAYTLLLAWGEALVSGMIFSSLVIFLPRAVPTYDQDLYLPRPA